MPLSSSDRSVNPREVARFSAQADQWWSAAGPFRALHDLGPLRLAYVREQAATHLGKDTLKGLRILDVGCGGGLMAEPMARAGAKVTGIDASAPAIEAARAHAAQGGLTLDYRVETAESLAAQNERFDIVTALEIVEHVADLKSFMRALATLLKPGGLLIVATVNRTKRSFLSAVVLAEYVLGWVPAGTHDWEAFVKPSELIALWEGNGVKPVDSSGVVYRPLSRRFERVKGRAGVNYFITGKKQKKPRSP